MPSSPAAVAGRYSRCLGCSSIYLTLAADGTYVAELYGLAGGECHGRWQLNGSQIRFDSPNEKTMATFSLDYSSPLEVLWSDRDWVLLSSAAADREYYDQYGISRDVCFVKFKSLASIYPACPE